MQCPKCGLTQPDTSAECLRCGIVFAKIGGGPAPSASVPEPLPQSIRPRRGDPADADRERPTRPVEAPRGLPLPLPEQGEAAPIPAPVGAGHGLPVGVSATSEEEELLATVSVDDESDLIPEPRHMEREDWLVLASGPVIALVIMCFPLINHIFGTLVILIHEMGHAIVGWLLGYPSLPAFDLMYGGGVTMHMERSVTLLTVFYGLMAFLLYLYRKNTPTLVVLGVFTLVHLTVALTYWHEVVVLFMGHGTELVIGGIFFYRAISGAAVVHSAERPLYSAISFFIVFSDIRFAYRLATSLEEREMYEEAKGGGHWMDFSRIAEEFLHVPLRYVAIFFFLCCFLPPVLGYLSFRYQEHLRKLITRLAKREPAASSNQ